MLGSWVVVVEGFGFVSEQGNYNKGANVMNFRIWVEGAFLVEPRCVAKIPRKISTTDQHAGGVAR